MNTSGDNAYAGIGAGYVETMATVTGTRSLNSKATATGNFDSGRGYVKPAGLPPTVTGTTVTATAGFAPTSAVLPLGAMAGIGIAAGAAVALAVGGLCIYHKYLRPAHENTEGPEVA